MCYYSKQSKGVQEIESRFNATIENAEEFRVQENLIGFTFPKTPVITHSNPDTIQHLHWGLIPYWANDREIRRYTLNAKIETLHEKPSFKHSINKRCLIIADGFYEWQWLDSKGKQKQKYLITLPDNGLFAFGGIWSEWNDNTTGEKINSYSIVTTEANELMAQIHNTKKRMPVVLSEKNEQDWLKGNPTENFKKIDIELTAIKILA